MDDSERAAALEAALRSDGYYVEMATDKTTASKIRSEGRRVGRALKWKVQTLQRPSASESDGPFEVHVLVIEADPLHQRLHDARHWKAMREAIGRLS